jgi:hypothetical protein
MFLYSTVSTLKPDSVDRQGASRTRKKRSDEGKSAKRAKLEEGKRSQWVGVMRVGENEEKSESACHVWVNIGRGRTDGGDGGDDLSELEPEAQQQTRRQRSGRLANSSIFLQRLSLALLARIHTCNYKVEGRGTGRSARAKGEEGERDRQTRQGDTYRIVVFPAASSPTMRIPIG